MNVSRYDAVTAAGSGVVLLSAGSDTGCTIQDITLVNTTSNTGYCSCVVGPSQVVGVFGIDSNTQYIPRPNVNVVSGEEFTLYSNMSGVYAAANVAIWTGEAPGQPEPGSSGVEPGSSSVEPGSSGIEPPTSGLILYAPLSAAADSAVTGQVFASGTNTVNYVGYNGVPCVEFSATSSYLAFASGAMATSATVSFWGAGIGVASGSALLFANVNFMAGMTVGYVAAINSSYPCAYYPQGGSISSGSVTVDDNLHYYTLTCDGATTTLMIDTQASLSFPVSGLLQLPYTVLGAATVGGYNKWSTDKHYMAALRIYDRVLTAEEIALLSSEFTPNSSLSVDSNFTWDPYPQQYIG